MDEKLNIVNGKLNSGRLVHFLAMLVSLECSLCVGFDLAGHTSFFPFPAKKNNDMKRLQSGLLVWYQCLVKFPLTPILLSKQICFPNGNVLFFSLFSLVKN